MSSPVPAALVYRDSRDTVRQDRDADRSFPPDFAWATVGGGMALVACVLLLILTVSWGGGPPVTSHIRELAGAFLAGFLVVLVARSLTARSR